MDRDELRGKAAAFRDLHKGPKIFMLPNAWDVGSAVIFARAGFPAIASTSSGIAIARGYPDGENISLAEMLSVVGRIVEKVSVPVSADLEGGYARHPRGVGETVRKALAAGIVGGNFEDSSVPRDQGLLDLTLCSERVRAAREAADAEGIPFVINARTDGYLVPGHDPASAFEESVRRANAYRAAGADCLFVPGKLDLDTIGRLADAIDGPLNVLGAISGYEAPPLKELEAAGVRRVTIGGSLSLAVLAFVDRVAKEILTQGTFSYAKDAFSNDQLNKLMRETRETEAD